MREHHHGSSQAVTIRSVPEGANVAVRNKAGQPVHEGTTPVTLTLKRGAGYFRSETYDVVFAKDGFTSKTLQIPGSLSGWYVGNIVFGGLIGMLAVDPLTGGMYSFPGTVSATLEAGTAPAERSPTIGVAPPNTAPAAVSDRIAVSDKVVVSDKAAVSAKAAVLGPLGSGNSMHTVERLPESRACSASPRAVLVAKGPGFETYTVACQDSSALVIQCEFRNCRLLR